MPLSHAAHVSTRDPGTAIAALARGLDGRGNGSGGDAGTLGILYVTEAAGGLLAAVLDGLPAATGVPAWVGAVGHGVCGMRFEATGEPAFAALTLGLAPDSFRVFAWDQGADDPAFADLVAWSAAARPILGLVHGDPRDPSITARVGHLAERTGCYLVGGLTGIGTPHPHAAGRMLAGGLSGVLIGGRANVAIGLTQGCTPLGPARRVTRAEGNVIREIDGRPALAVFRDDAAGELARGAGALAGRLFVAFPVAGSDAADYLVRNIVGGDPATGAVAVAHEVEDGQALLFCVRDRDAALADLDRMLKDLQRRAPRPAGALYHSCVARGEALFGPGAVESGRIADALGAPPLAGFFGNGEICSDRLYGYTGVLALFS